MVLKKFLKKKKKKKKMDNKLIEKQKGKAVFSFEIPLKKDLHIKVTSGNYADEMDIKKVNEENKEYSCENKAVLVNWFEESKDLKEDYFSTKDKVKDIKAHPIAGPIYTKMMSEAMKSFGDVSRKVEIPKEMQEKMVI